MIFYRFLCSSASAAIRAWSNLRVASRMIPAMILIIGLIYIHVLVYYQVNQQKTTCASVDGIYQKFFGICNLIVFGLGPPILMLLFGSLTIRHIRQTVRRIVPQNPQNHAEQQPQRRQKATDRQLIQMMLIQCFMFSATGIPGGILSIYTSAVSSVALNAVEKTLNNFLTTVFGFLALTGPCTSFYLFTLSSQLFRLEIFRLFTGRHGENRGTGASTILSKQRN